MLRYWGAWTVLVLVGCSSTGMGLQDGLGGAAGVGVGGAAGAGRGGAPGLAGAPPDGGITGAAGGALRLVSCASDNPPCPKCSDARYPSVMEFCVTESDAATRPDLSVPIYTGPATIVSVDEVTGSYCQEAGFSGSNEPKKRIVLQIPDRAPLTVYLRIPNLPAGRFTAGASVEVDVVGHGPAEFFEGSSQQITLSRAGKVLAFAAAVGGPGVRVPVTVKAVGDYVCQPTACAYSQFSVAVSAGGSAAIILPGQTTQLGTMSVTFGRYEAFVSDGTCDPAAKYSFDIAGFDTAAE
jgi:hypothetical protein